MIWFPDFPLPPSANTHLKPVRTRTGTRQIKSQEHSRYLDDCWLWSRDGRRRSYVDAAVEAVVRAAATAGSAVEFGLKIELMFLFHEERLFSSDGSRKRLDADNRVKPCLDALSTILGIDDRHFIRADFGIATTASKESECSVIRITRAGGPWMQDELLNHARKKMQETPTLEWAETVRSF